MKVRCLQFDSQGRFAGLDLRPGQARERSRRESDRGERSNETKRGREMREESEVRECHGGTGERTREMGSLNSGIPAGFGRVGRLKQG